MEVSCGNPVSPSFTSTTVPPSSTASSSISQLSSSPVHITDLSTSSKAISLDADVLSTHEDGDISLVVTSDADTPRDIALAVTSDADTSRDIALAVTSDVLSTSGKMSFVVTSDVSTQSTTIPSISTEMSSVTPIAQSSTDNALGKHNLGMKFYI